MFKKCICDDVMIKNIKQESENISEDTQQMNNNEINDNSIKDNGNKDKKNIVNYSLYNANNYYGRICIVKNGISYLYFTDDIYNNEIIINFKRINISNYRNYIIIKLNSKYYGKWYIKILKTQFLISKKYILPNSNIKNIIVIKRNIDKYSVRHYINYKN